MTPDFGELRVLVADDNAHMRSIVGTVLKSVGINEIKEARDGSAALTILRDWPADVIIVDYVMEPMDGVEMTRRVRNPQFSTNVRLPVIMLTGHADRSRVMEARDAGVSELIVKPVTARAVVERLTSVIYRPRLFVSTATYSGPCRRRRAMPYNGPERRGVTVLSA